MSHEISYNELIEEIKALPDEQVQKPDIPADVFAQEAVNLAKWAAHDKDALVEAKLDWSIVEGLEKRSSALRHAEALWLMERYKRYGARKEWSEYAPKAYNLRVVIMHAFRYGLADKADALRRVKLIDKGNGHDNMIQDLHALAVLGRKYAEDLAAINFDLELLTEAESTSMAMTGLLGESMASKEYAETKDIRDRAYTFLKQAVTVVRECGQYVFWRDTSRVAGYASDYLRSHRADNGQEPPETTVL